MKNKFKIVILGLLLIVFLTGGIFYLATFFRDLVKAYGFSNIVNAVNDCIKIGFTPTSSCCYLPDLYVELTHFFIPALLAFFVSFIFIRKIIKKDLTASEKYKAMPIILKILAWFMVVTGGVLIISWFVSFRSWSYMSDLFSFGMWVFTLGFLLLRGFKKTFAILLVVFLLILFLIPGMSHCFIMD